MAEFPVSNLETNISGSSTVNANIFVRLDARLSGASELRYKGDALIGSLQSSGASIVSSLP
ncbi:hypothetical protein ACFLYV_04325 [Chloroflexota bacterium]